MRMMNTGAGHRPPGDPSCWGQKDNDDFDNDYDADNVDDDRNNDDDHDDDDEYGGWSLCTRRSPLLRSKDDDDRENNEEDNDDRDNNEDYDGSCPRWDPPCRYKRYDDSVVEWQCNFCDVSKSSSSSMIICAARRCGREAWGEWVHCGPSWFSGGWAKVLKIMMTLMVVLMASSCHHYDQDYQNLWYYWCWEAPKNSWYWYYWYDIDIEQPPKCSCHTSGPTEDTSSEFFFWWWFFNDGADMQKCANRTNLLVLILSI